MPCRAEILALFALLMHALPAIARPAVGGIPGWSEGSNGVGNIGNLPQDHDYDYGLAYEFTHTPQQSDSDGPDDLCGGGHGGNGGHGGGSGGGGGGGGGSGGGSGGDGNYLSTVTISDCTTAGPITTVTVTIGDNGSGMATITEIITTGASTITETSCTATLTVDNGINPDTVTVTDTLFSSISDCTATTSDLTTVTIDGPTTTELITTAGPTVTSTITTGEETVTEPGSTETETITDTSISIETTTFTNMQVLTSTETITHTDTLEITKTITSDTCSNTGGGGGNTIDYGTCSDPYILYEYGLDGRTEYAYTTRNQADFPFGSSPTIGSVDDLICNRLRSPCNAPQATIDLCYEAEDAVANLSGQEAADVWNSIMT